MKVDGKAMRSIWVEPDGWSVGVIDQTALPHRLATARLATLEEEREQDKLGASVPGGGFDQESQESKTRRSANE